MNDDTLRTMRTQAAGQNGSVLPTTRKASAPRVGRLGLFGAADNADSGRRKQVVEPPISDFDGSIRDELLRLLKRPLSEIDVDPDPTSVSTGQMFALILMRKAVKDQTLNAIIEVLDRIEGKATKAAQNKPTNNHIGEQLDANLTALDELAE